MVATTFYGDPGFCSLECARARLLYLLSHLPGCLSFYFLRIRGFPPMIEEGSRVGLSYYSLLTKKRSPVGKEGTVKGLSDRYGGFREERTRLILVRWDDDEEDSTVHPDNLVVLDETPTPEGW